MILVGSQRSGAVALANHLMNENDNDHVTVLEVNGFISDDLHGALKEAHAISKATRCKQFMFSLSLSPPIGHLASETEFLDAANRVETSLGLVGQPRAVVVHEKEGRRHAHVVWSRIDVNEMKAVNLPHYKTRLRDLAKELFLHHGWDLPNGLATYGNKNPLNFSLEEWQQANRNGMDPRELKATFQGAFARSDTLSAFKNALQERGYFLARGDRRGLVALDFDGNVYAVSRWTGLKAREVNAKFGETKNLPSVSEAASQMRSRLSGRFQDYINETKRRQETERAPLQRERDELVYRHREERRKTANGQRARWLSENKTRLERFRKGVRGLLDRVTGRHIEIERANILDAMRCAYRDRRQREHLFDAQLGERRELQSRIEELRSRHAGERKQLAAKISESLRLLEGYQKQRSRRSKTCQIVPYTDLSV